MVSVFAGKKIVLGVTGSIAAFKVAGWASAMAKEDADVQVIMTESARKFVTSLTFAAITGNKVHCAMFDESAEESMAHIDLGRDADLVVIAPATANCIAKLAAGIGDDLLGTTVLATRARILLAPAMNSRMYTNKITQRNLETLKELGFVVLEPESGSMACREEGVGRLPEWETAVQVIGKYLSHQDLSGRSLLITAGPTREMIDPARFLSNRSSGKMGYALAEAAFRRGGDVTLVSGPTSLEVPYGVKFIQVESASEMREVVLAEASASDIVIKSAAVADYRPKISSSHKIKKDKITQDLELEQNTDILYELGQIKRKKQVLVGFAAESQNLLKEGRRKLKKKNLDLVAVNDIGGANTGFEVNTNQITLVSTAGEELLPLTSKAHTADLILDRVVRCCG